ncbi:MAG: alpha/beta hydrolase-fold protein [Thomasclavelia ramosa]
MTIYVPDDYKTSNKQYPVLYINDGQNAFDEESFMKVSWGFYDFVKVLI